jgi:YbbR domain-containing protein
MSLHALFFKDFWLKLFSLVLAVLIWTTVSYAIHNENSTANPIAANAPTRDFYVPVLVVSAAADVRQAHVKPSSVEVTVRGDADALAKMVDKDVRVLVDLSDIESARGVRKKVEVSTPPGVTHDKVFPDEVEIIVPPKQ